MGNGVTVSIKFRNVKVQFYKFRIYKQTIETYHSLFDVKFSFSAISSKISKMQIPRATRDICTYYLGGSCKYNTNYQILNYTIQELQPIAVTHLHEEKNFYCFYILGLYVYGGSGRKLIGTNCQYSYFLCVAYHCS